MKKILTLLTLVTLITAQTAVNALSSVNVDSQKDINKGTVNQIMTKKSSDSAIFEAKAAELTNRYLNNIRTCEPLHYSQYIDFFGLKLDVNININGWVSDKCQYSLSGKIGGLGKDIREVFELNIADEKISKLEPKIECNFTKNELNAIVAAIIARSERNEEITEQMLKSADKKYSQQKKPELTPEEEQLIAILSNGQACRILNKDELMNNFAELVNSGGL